MGRLLSFALILSSFVLEANAQIIPGGVEAGRISGRFDPQKIPQAKATPRRGLESTMAPGEAAKVKLVLKGIVVEGNTVFSDAELAEIYSELIGKQISLKQVFDVAATITARYGKAGYALSRAIVQIGRASGRERVLRLV